MEMDELLDTHWPSFPRVIERISTCVDFCSHIKTKNLEGITLIDIIDTLSMRRDYLSCQNCGHDLIDGGQHAKECEHAIIENLCDKIMKEL